jgi:sugar fermentation stimulation protein A
MSTTVSELISATFVARPNRFIVRARLDDGSEVDTHLGDPGRLEDLLLPGATLRLLPASGAKRKTAFTVSLVRADSGAWVSVETTRANRLAEDLLRRGLVEGFPLDHDLKREAKAGKSRFDFLASRDSSPPLWIEVKSATFVSDRVARFPDAPTARGRRHVSELTERVKGGERAMILFVVQRHDADSVEPFTAIDPEFTRVLGEAKAAGVLLRAARFRLDEDGSAEHLGPVPVVVPQQPVQMIR